jgi:hypothetical protein
VQLERHNLLLNVHGQDYDCIAPHPDNFTFDTLFVAQGIPAADL